jgi:hypothetical protein
VPASQMLPNQMVNDNQQVSDLDWYDILCSN